VRCRERQFSAFSLAISLETSEIRPALLHSEKQSVDGFSVIPNCITLNGYFALNSVFAPLCLASEGATFENNCVKTNKDRPILSAAQVIGSHLVSGSIRFRRIFARKESSKTDVNARLEHFLAFEEY